MEQRDRTGCRRHSGVKSWSAWQSQWWVLRIDAGWRSPPGLRLWSLAIGVGSVGAALSTRRWWIAVGLLVGLGALAG